MISLDVDSVLDMTDNDHKLFIQGDLEDSVTLVGSWTKSDTTFVGDDGQTYSQYTATASGGATVTVYVDQDIPTTV